jgi:hypothetical protein
MSKFQINAEIDSTEVTFDYHGKELVTPLSELREHLLSQADALMKQIGLKSSREIPAFADLAKRDPESETKQKIRLCLSDAFEASLWLQEAGRTPDKVWRLTMAKLKWLYRQQAPT